MHFACGCVTIIYTILIKILFVGKGKELCKKKVETTILKLAYQDYSTQSLIDCKSPTETTLNFIVLLILLNVGLIGLSLFLVELWLQFGFECFHLTHSNSYICVCLNNRLSISSLYFFKTRSICSTASSLRFLLFFLFFCNDCSYCFL